MIRDGVQPIDVASVVKEIRHARNFMVQTFVQYAFIFRTVLDYLRDNLHVVAAEVKRRQALQPAEPEPEEEVAPAPAPAPAPEPATEPAPQPEPQEPRTVVTSGTATISRKALQQVRVTCAEIQFSPFVSVSLIYLLPQNILVSTPVSTPRWGACSNCLV